MEIKDVLGTGEIAKEAVKQVGEMAKEPIINLAIPTSKTIGQRLSDIFDLVFTPVELAKIYKDHKIEQFKNKLAEEISKIPVDKRVTPPINVVGPAIEASRFYIDNEMLRDMFAKLIACSIHCERVAMTHPSFVETIKQLSPLDAEMIAYFKQDKLTALADYLLIFPDPKNNHTRIPLINNIVLSSSECNDIFEISNSITNLLRLGLIEKDYERALGNYEDFKTEEILKQVKMGMSGFIDNSMIDIKRAIVHPTTYGKFFAAACV